MREIRHTPAIEDAGTTVCVSCKSELPAEVALAAIAADSLVIEIPTTRDYYPASRYDARSALDCLKAEGLITRDPLYFDHHADCEGNGCEECGYRGIVAWVLKGDEYTMEQIESAPTKDPDAVPIPKKTEMEKMVSRVAWNNFLAMREMTRLKSPEELLEEAGNV